MPDALLLVAVAGVFIIGYGLGYTSGHSQGKVEAVEALENVDLSTGGDDDA